MPVVSADAVPAGLRHGAEEHVHSSDRAQVRLAPERPTATLTAAGDLLRALAAPVRIAIVLELREAERCVHELVTALGVTQPLISQHLRVLKDAGVVSGEKRGREVIYRLVDEHLAHIVVDAVSHAEEATQATPGTSVRTVAGAAVDHRTAIGRKDRS
jgi:DNA-binding transcriptional ArsR family regulator